MLGNGFAADVLKARFNLPKSLISSVLLGTAVYIDDAAVTYRSIYDDGPRFQRRQQRDAAPEPRERR